MDVLITEEARRELEAFRLFRPAPGAWGVLVGHRRGNRVIVEKAVAAGSPGAAPDARLVAGLDGLWPGMTVGLFVRRPGAAFRKAVLGPLWYGKVVLVLSGASEAPVLRPFEVELGRGFKLVPVPLAPEPEEEARE